MSTKRTYTNRRNEFADLTAEQVKSKLPEIKTQLDALNVKLCDANLPLADKDLLLEEQKTITNFRVRVYNRLRALGVNSKEQRSIRAAQKKALKATPEAPQPTQEASPDVGKANPA